MRISRWGGAAVLGAAVGLALAAPASAQDAPTVETTRTGGDCGTQTFTTAWAPDARQVDNTVLVVQAAGEQHVAAIGETIAVGPFEAEQVTIRWRVWGGAERDHDDPQLDSLDALLAYLEEHPGGELDMDPAGVAWRNRTVNGCVPEPTPGPTTEPTGEPTAEPSKPAVVPSDPAGGAGGGGGDEKPGLPVTGVPIPLLAGGGAVAAGLGGLALWLARRRGATFTA